MDANTINKITTDCKTTMKKDTEKEKQNRFNLKQRYR